MDLTGAVNDAVNCDPWKLNQMIATSERLDGLLKICLEHGRAFNHVNVATAMHRLAKMNHKKNVIPSLESRLQSVIDEMTVRANALQGLFKPREIANLMWAYATLGREPGAELAGAMSRRAVSTAGKFNPQEIANLMWAYATLGLGRGHDVGAGAGGGGAAVEHGRGPDGRGPGAADGLLGRRAGGGVAARGA